MTTLTPFEHTRIAKVIHSQLGGGGFDCMTGAKNLVALDTPGGGLQFSFPQAHPDGKPAVNKCVIVLDPSDTYTVRFWYIRGVNYKLVSEFTDIYAEDLQDLFTRTTGLETQFPTIRRM